MTERELKRKLRRMFFKISSLELDITISSLVLPSFEFIMDI